MPKVIRQRLHADKSLRAIYHTQNTIKSSQLINQAIEDTRFIIMDTETTGFHAYAGDEIISIAMIEYHGLQPTGNTYQTYVNPQRPIPAESTSIHGIIDNDVQDAPTLEQLLPEILAYIDNAVIVGHHIEFDIRFLNKTLRKFLGLQLQNPWLDTMLLFLAYQKRLGHYQLEDAAADCGIAIHNRHTAMGDAQAAGELFAYLAKQLSTPSGSIFSLRNQQVKKDGL